MTIDQNIEAAFRSMYAMVLRKQDLITRAIGIGDLEALESKEAAFSLLDRTTEISLSELKDLERFLKQVQTLICEHELYKIVGDEFVAAVNEYESVDGVRWETKAKRFLNRMKVTAGARKPRISGKTLLFEYIELLFPVSELSAMTKSMQDDKVEPRAAMEKWEAIEHLTDKYQIASMDAYYQRLKSAHNDLPIDEKTGKKPFPGFLPRRRFTP